jgi:hypothetical protein
MRMERAGSPPLISGRQKATTDTMNSIATRIVTR